MTQVIHLILRNLVLKKKRNIKVLLINMSYFASLFIDVYSNHRTFGIRVQSRNMKNSPIGLQTMSGNTGVRQYCNRNMIHFKL